MTLREAARLCSFDAAINLIVTAMILPHAFLDAGLQPDFEYPGERDACGMFCVFGYPHVAACVIGQILAVARPTIAWRVVCGPPSHACVLGNGFIVGRMRSIL